MKVISIITTLMFVLFIANNKTKDFNTNKGKGIKALDSCFFNGKKLYGKIRFVENAFNADVKIKFVTSFPDLKVKLVNNFANDCGKWEVVENNADLNVCVVESFADIRVKIVESFPGLN